MGYNASCPLFLSAFSPLFSFARTNAKFYEILFPVAHISRRFSIFFSNFKRFWIVIIFFFYFAVVWRDIKQLLIRNSQILYADFRCLGKITTTRRQILQKGFITESAFLVFFNVLVLGGWKSTFKPPCQCRHQLLWTLLGHRRIGGALSYTSMPGHSI